MDDMEVETQLTKIFELLEEHRKDILKLTEAVKQFTSTEEDYKLGFYRRHNIKTSDDRGGD